MKAYVDQALIKFLTERQLKVAFPVPSTALLIPPLEIKSAASGAHLSAFREVMNFDNLTLSFSLSAQYEAAGTVWMLVAINDSGSDAITISQLESAMWMWYEEALLLSPLILLHNAIRLMCRSPPKLWMPKLRSVNIMTKPLS